MTEPVITRDAALSLLRQYNSEEFHLRHARTLEGVLRWFAREEGYADEADYWAAVGLLHDIDFERWPEEHCVRCRTLLKEAGLPDSFIRSVASHGWGICSEIKPEHQMEKILFATDELTGLIWAAALMRPSKSVRDLELSSVKKKFKDKRFAAGCSREVILQGAQLLGWELDDLITRTILAMRDAEGQGLAV